MNKRALKILLVEDNRDHIELFQTNLKMTNYANSSLIISSVLKDALNKLREESFDITFLDLSLQDSDIEETLVRINEFAIFCPVIVITSLDDKETILEVINRGADDCIPKPELNDTLLERTIRFTMDRWQLKNQLTESKRRLDNILWDTDVGTWEWNVHSGETFLNERWAEIIGYSLKELSPTNIETWYKYAHPDDLKLSDMEFQKHFNGEMAAYECEVRMKHRDGHWVWTLGRGKVTEWTMDQKPLWVSGTLFDISKRKEMQITLRDNEKLLKGLIDNTPSVIYLKQTNGQYILINKQFEKIFNLTNESVKGKFDWQIFPKEFADKFTENDCRVKDREEPIFFEEVAPHSDGPHTYISTKFPLRNDSGQIYAVAGISTDITYQKKTESELQRYQSHLEEMIKERTRELKKTQDSLHHADKLSTLGKLVGSVAHEFNNPLYGVSGIIDLLKDDMPAEKKEELVNLAKKECLRMSDMIKNLQDFYKPSPGVVSSVDINQVIDDVLIIMDKDIKKKGIKIIKNLADNIASIEAVEDQIKQVIINFFLNAEDALLENKGEITIATEQNKTSVIVKIHDNGNGIPEEDIKNLFEPFFTTKGVKGTGLGLSVSYGIVKKHSGNIEVESVLGKGSTFIVTLPIKSNCL